MKNKEKIRIKSGAPLFTYIVIDIVLGIVLYLIRTLIFKNTNLFDIITQGREDTALVLVCLLNSINVFIVTLIFCLVAKKLYIIDRFNLERFIKKAIILFTFLTVGSIVLSAANGYKKIYTDLHTLEVVCHKEEEKFKENPENYVGTGVTEGCKSLEDITKAEKDTMNAWIAHYFVLPIIPSGVNLLVTIVCLNGLSKVFFKFEEDDLKEESEMI